MKILTTANGLRVQVAGDWAKESTTALVFIHGMGGSLHNFERLQNLISETAPTVSVELPAHGKSANPTAEWTVESIVSAVEASTFEIVGSRPIVIVGHSLGVLIATRLSLRTTLQVERLIGISGALFSIGFLLHHPVKTLFSHPIRMIVFRYALFTASTRPSKEFCDRLNSKPGWQRLLWPFMNPRLTAQTKQVGDSFRDQGGKGASRLLRLAKDVDVTRSLQEISVPISFILGSRDPLIPAVDRSRAAELFGSQEVTIVTNAAHWPQVEAPEEVAALAVFARST